MVEIKDDLSVFIVGRIVLSTKTNELGFISQVSIFDRFPTFRVCWTSDIDNKDDMFICREFDKGLYPAIKYFDVTLTYAELEHICFNLNNSEQSKNQLNELLKTKIKNRTSLEFIGMD